MKRFLEIDLLKVLALAIMPMSHIFDEFGNYYDLMKDIPQTSTLELGLLFMNIPTIFMICLGFGIVFSKNSTPQKLLQRGLWMFVIEGVLNLFRITVPHFSASFFTGNSEYFAQSFEIFLMSDILPFAGFAFLFFALVKKFDMSKTMVLFIGLFLTLIQTIIPQYEIQNVYLKHLAGYFIYIDDTSFFPIVSWLIYPIIGYLLANKLIKVENKTRCYLKIGGLGLIIFTITNLFLLLTNSMQARYYLYMETGFHMDLMTTLIVLSIGLIVVSVAYFVCSFIKNKLLIKVINNISKNVNSIYCIHWVLVKILWTFAVIYNYKIEYNQLFFIGFLIFVVSSIIAQIRKTILASV